MFMRISLLRPGIIRALTLVAAASLADHTYASAQVLENHDQSSPEAVIAALYASNSVRPGESHNWSRFRALFAPNALLMIRVRDGSLRMMTVDNFIQDATKQEGPGFVEREIVRRMEKYGHIAHAWSSYEAIFGTGASQQSTQGVNSLQLALVNDRWVIVSILWETTRSGGALPANLTDSP